MIIQDAQNETSLCREMSALGIAPGTTLMVHSSLSAIGWVIGGAPSVVRALQSVLGEQGTLVMPTATPQGHDPVDWPEPRPPEHLFEEIRQHMPVFDVATTPSAMGAITEAFRTAPGTLRSNHPTSAVCANGPDAASIVAAHTLDVSEGRGTPFEVLYEMASTTLLLGVGFNRCTSLHFAESLCEKRRLTLRRNLWRQNGTRMWMDMQDMADDNDTYFPEIGRAFLAGAKAKTGTIGCADAVLFSTRELVDFAKDYFDTVL